MKPKKTVKNADLVENSRKTTCLPRVAQQLHMDQAYDWKHVTSYNDDTYVRSQE